MHKTLFCLMMVTLAAAACGSGSSGGGGSGAGGACASTPAFKEVLAKPLSGCSGYEPPCHNASAGNLHIDPMDPKGTYAALVDHKTYVKGAGIRVVPGDPASSFLYKKLTGDLGPNDGDPMPKSGGLIGPSGGGNTWNELPRDQLEIVRCWIAGGADEN